MADTLPPVAPAADPVWCESVAPLIRRLIGDQASRCDLIRKFINEAFTIREINRIITDKSRPDPASLAEKACHALWNAFLTDLGQTINAATCLDETRQLRTEEFSFFDAGSYCFGPNTDFNEAFNKKIECYVVFERPKVFFKFPSAVQVLVSNAVDDLIALHNNILRICEPPVPDQPPPPDPDKCCQEVKDKLDLLIRQAQTILAELPPPTEAPPPPKWTLGPPPPPPPSPLEVEEETPPPAEEQPPS